MEMIISFFRDFLSGPLYIAMVIINSILICAGIGYFAEKSQIRKKEREKFKDTHIAVENIPNQNINNAALGDVVSSKVNSPIVGNIVNQMNQQVPNQNIKQPIQNNNQIIK